MFGLIISEENEKCTTVKEEKDARYCVPLHIGTVFHLANAIHVQIIKQVGPSRRPKSKSRS